MKNKLGVGEIVRTEYGTEFVVLDEAYFNDTWVKAIPIDPVISNRLIRQILIKVIKSTEMQDVSFYLSRGLDFNLWEVYRSERLKELGI